MTGFINRESFIRTKIINYKNEGSEKEAHYADVINRQKI